MVNDSIVSSRLSNLIKGLSRIGDLKPKLGKVHDYSDMTPGVDYFFGPSGEKDIGEYMTSQRRGVKVGDHILLTQNGSVKKYLVQEINYYSSPCDMWMALLTRNVPLP